MTEPGIFNEAFRREMQGILGVLPGVVLRRAGYFLKGKHLRSGLLLAVTGKLGVESTRVALPAAILELVHTTSILHDDVIDHTQSRRGQQTVNRALKSRIAVFAADLLFSHSMRRLHEWAAREGRGGRAVERCFHRQIRRVCEGELVQDLRYSEAAPPTEAECLEIARGKTGALFALSFLVPGELSELPPAALAWLEEAGSWHGTLFQLLDDVNDLAEDLRGAGEFHHWTYASRFWKERDPQGLARFLADGESVPPGGLVRELADHVLDYAGRSLAALEKRCPTGLEGVASLLRERSLELLEPLHRAGSAP